MTKTMLIDAAHAEETRVAVVDGNRIEEFDFESRAKKQLRGNIYLARVTRVEPSLQAAFVEYGGNRHGFLSFNEVHPDYYQIPVADREALLREEAEENERRDNGGPAHRDAIDEHGENGDGEEAGGEEDDDVLAEESERRRRRLLRRYKIQEVIKRRQIMLVQVVKDERGGKGASLTTYLSLAGRYCVLMPNTARGGGISRKIASAADRKRLKDIVQGLDVPDGMGLIVRTAGAKRTKAEIKRDYEYLSRLWENIRDTTLSSIAPALIYEEEDLVKRAIRDMFDKDIDAVFVEGEQGFRDAREFMRMLMPAQAKKVQLHRDGLPLFVKHKLEDSLAQIYSPVAPLKSGGYLVINQTEALVAIDVNSGKSTRERSIETTALKTNLEAADEAARQLRLRDLAGLIVIDFIDMDESKNNRAVEKRLKDALKDDRARIQIGRISSFGLMELSRQRRRTGVLEGTTQSCQHCQGSGRIRSVESSALAALRAVDIEGARHGPGSVVLRAPTAVGLYILNEKRAHLMRLHAQQGLFVQVQFDDSATHGEFEVNRLTTLAEGEGRPPAEDLALLPPPVELEEDDFEADVDVEEDEEEEEALEAAAEPAEAEDSEDGEGHGRGRRRRRRGRRGDEPRDAAPREPRADEAVSTAAESDHPAQGEGDEGERRRRRRRGRRGGARRPQEEGRTAGDVYSWTRARTPDGSDPFGWYDTAPDASLIANDAGPTPAPTEPAARRGSRPAPAEPTEVWVELPAEPEPRAKSARARRGRKPASEAAATEALTPQVEPAPALEPELAPEPVAVVAEPEAPAKPARRTRKPKAVESQKPESPPAATTVVAIADAVPAPEPDPAEVTAPPAQPRRGWWRRGG